eukprot:comp22414_c0_seq1/m.54651 comp22414_c0_seq1/g.54651  ORF comp22414_c0_seq1/g.54651 comp22414_c0_seq1/m.54651 type:complete len:635 (-) comp22414_c0_seq1:945-2849(-)
MCCRTLLRRNRLLVIAGGRRSSYSSSILDPKCPVLLGLAWRRCVAVLEHQKVVHLENTLEHMEHIAVESLVVFPAAQCCLEQFVSERAHQHVQKGHDGARDLLFLLAVHIDNVRKHGPQHKERGKADHTHNIDLQRHLGCIGELRVRAVQNRRRNNQTDACTQRRLKRVVAVLGHRLVDLLHHKRNKEHKQQHNHLQLGPPRQERRDNRNHNLEQLVRRAPEGQLVPEIRIQRRVALCKLCKAQPAPVAVHKDREKQREPNHVDNNARNRNAKELPPPLLVADLARIRRQRPCVVWLLHTVKERKGVCNHNHKAEPKEHQKAIHNTVQQRRQRNRVEREIYRACDFAADPALPLALEPLLALLFLRVVQDSFILCDSQCIMHGLNAALALRAESRKYAHNNVLQHRKQKDGHENQPKGHGHKLHPHPLHLVAHRGHTAFSRKNIGAERKRSRQRRQNLLDERRHVEVEPANNRKNLEKVHSHIHRAAIAARAREADRGENQNRNQNAENHKANHDEQRIARTRMAPLQTLVVVGRAERTHLAFGSGLAFRRPATGALLGRLAREKELIVPFCVPVPGQGNRNRNPAAAVGPRRARRACLAGLAGGHVESLDALALLQRIGDIRVDRGVLRARCA